MSDESEYEWLIYRLTCPDCGAISRADRFVRCFKCGTEMEADERIGEVTDHVK